MALAIGGLAAPVAGAAAATYQSHGRATERTVEVCPTRVPAGYATCLAERVAGPDRPASLGPPGGALTPAELQDAYNLTGLLSQGRTVAVVAAYGYPNLEADLATFRAYFGLPACTTASGCLTIMNQNGGSDLPPFNLGWAQDQALAIDAVSAACPDCRILVVEAAANSFVNLGKSVVTAARQKGVVAVSNSYAGGDVSDSQLGRYYHQAGVAVTASTGDGGFQGGAYPASSHFVTAVGGTSLTTSSNRRGWRETGWTRAGSGCSIYNKRIKGSRAFHTGCGSFRAMADVSAAADPVHGGLATYWPVNESQSAWAQVGGTSESAPIIAAVYALSGDTSGLANEIPYANSRHLYDITKGIRGATCHPTQLCNTRKGWDGPTGLGTPNGTAGF